MPTSMAVSVVETKQGMYKEYTVDRKDDSAVDTVSSTYKTAEQTEEKKSQVGSHDLVKLSNIFLIFSYFFHSIGLCWESWSLAHLLFQWFSIIGMSPRKIKVEQIEEYSHICMYK